MTTGLLDYRLNCGVHYVKTFCDIWPRDDDVINVGGQREHFFQNWRYLHQTLLMGVIWGADFKFDIYLFVKCIQATWGQRYDLGSNFWNLSYVHQTLYMGVNWGPDFNFDIYYFVKHLLDSMGANTIHWGSIFKIWATPTKLCNWG